MKTIELPCPLGETVWVSPNNGKSYHSATLLGIKANEQNIKHVAFIVEVNDKEREWVENPVSKPFVDYFAQVLTRKEMKTRFS